MWDKVRPCLKKNFGVELQERVMRTKASQGPRLERRAWCEPQKHQASRSAKPWHPTHCHGLSQAPRGLSQWYKASKSMIKEGWAIEFFFQFNPLEKSAWRHPIPPPCIDPPCVHGFYGYFALAHGTFKLKIGHRPNPFGSSSPKSLAEGLTPSVGWLHKACPTN